MKLDGTHWVAAGRAVDAPLNRFASVSNAMYAQHRDCSTTLTENTSGRGNLHPSLVLCDAPHVVSDGKRADAPGPPSLEMLAVLRLGVLELVVVVLDHPLRCEVE